MSTKSSGIERSKVRKIVFMVIAFGMFIGFTAPAYQVNDLEQLGLKGNVKSMMEIKYTILDTPDTVIKDTIIYQKYTAFDRDGNETGYVISKEGGDTYSAKYLIDTSGRQVELNEYNPDRTLRFTAAFKYDEEGNRVEAEYRWTQPKEIDEHSEEAGAGFNPTETIPYTKVLYKNDYRGFSLEEEYLKANGSIAFKIIHKYDFRGNLEEWTYFNSSGYRSWNAKYLYDRYNNMIESELFKSDRIAIKSVYRYKFDSLGNWTSRIEEKEVHKNIFTALLDQRNNITERRIEYYK